MFRATVLIAAAAGAAWCQSAKFEWVRQIGGSGGQTVAGVATDRQGNVYVAGTTLSLDLPVQSAFQPHAANSGLFRIDGGGGQWQNVYQAGLTAVNWLSADPRNPGTLYAVSGQSISRSGDGGATWAQAASLDFPIYCLAVDPFASNVLYAGTAGGGVFKSSDSGATWAAANNGIPPGTDGRPYVYRVAGDPWNPGVVFAMTYAGFARSADGGATWLAETSISAYVLASAIAFDPAASGTIYLGHSQGLAKSTDDGLTWSALPTPGSYFEPDAIAIDPLHPGTLFAGTSYSGLFRSTDGGTTWVNRTGSPIYALLADTTGNVYAGSYNRVLLSSDGFDSYTPIGPQVTGINTMTLAGGHLYIGTQASSDVYVAKLDAQGSVEWATYFGGA